jgi:CheY-like chemotaxis protein
MREAGAGAPSSASRPAMGVLVRDAARPSEEATVPESRRGDDTAPAGNDASRDRILVVDDEPAVRRFVVDALRASGYDVESAGSGREALVSIYGETPAPALLVADIEMPGMSGVELAARVRADRPSVRVILMTRGATSAAHARERAGLVEGVLLKPFGLPELLDAVLDVLARHGQER